MREILTSAAVAAVITLLIEYVAKPGLDARKERILETARQRRDAHRSLQRALFLAGRLLAYRDEPLQEWRDEAVPIAQDIPSLLIGVTAAVDLPLTVEGLWNNCSARAYGFARMVGHYDQEPSAETWELFDRDTDRLGDFDDLFGLPRWRWLRRRTLLRHLEAAAVSEEAAGAGSPLLSDA